MNDDTTCIQCGIECVSADRGMWVTNAGVICSECMRQTLERICGDRDKIKRRERHQSSFVRRILRAKRGKR